MLLSRQLLSRAGELGLLGPHRPSRSQAGPVLRVSRLKIRTQTPITATAAAAFSEYIASPATVAEPMAIPSNGTVQHATHAMPVIQAIRLVADILGFSAFDTVKSFLSGRACTVKHGVRSTVKPDAETPNPSIEGTRSGLRPTHAPHVKRWAS